MLVLTRKIGEKLFIDGGIVVEVLQCCGNRVKLGIAAPLDVSVLRGEVTTAGEAVARSSLTAVRQTPNPRSKHGRANLQPVDC